MCTDFKNHTNIFNYLIFNVICYFCKALIKYEFQIISKPANE